MITPLVSASASRATSALAASPRPSSPKLPQGHTVGPLDLALKALLNLNENASACSFGLALSPQGGPQPAPASQQPGVAFAPPQCPPWLPKVAEATRVIAPKFLMVPLLAQKAGLDDKVKVFVLYVEPITDMIDRSLKADAH